MPVVTRNYRFLSRNYRFLFRDYNFLFCDYQCYTDITRTVITTVYLVIAIVNLVITTFYLARNYPPFFS